MYRKSCLYAAVDCFPLSSKAFWSLRASWRDLAKSGAWVTKFMYGPLLAVTILFLGERLLADAVTS
jgi:small basic protein